MDEFELQIKLLKACGIERYPSERKKKLNNFIIFWYTFTNLYCVFSAGALLNNLHDTSQVFEIFSIIPAGIFMIKYVVFFFNKEKFFRVIDDIGMLNGKCKYFEFS